MHALHLATVLAITTALCAQVDPLGRSILFVRGADASGGATEGGTAAQRTEQLGDITNTSTALGNHGYATLAAQLRAAGFTVSQIVESSTPLDVATLAPHRVVVLGSNNKVYTATEVQAFHDYIDKGGSALFISDANWGPTWEAAPASDNQFLARYGAQVYQDSGQLPRMSRSTAGRYLVADHPALSGPDGIGGADDVDDYDGEGVNLFRITKGAGGWQAIAAVSALGLSVRTNTTTGGPGTVQPATATDAAMFFVEKGTSRLLGHFDRNTFFNRNGAGTDLHKLHNERLALGIIRYLASVRATQTPLGSGCGSVAAPWLFIGDPVLGRATSLVLSGAAVGTAGFLVMAPGGAVPLAFPGGCTTFVDLTAAQPILPILVNAARVWIHQIQLPANFALSGLGATCQAVTWGAGGPFFGGELSNGVVLVAGYPR